MLALWNTENPDEPEVAFIVKQVLLNNALLALCEEIGRAYPLLPAEILMAYQDTEYHKFDARLWVNYLYVLIDTIAQMDVSRLPATVVKAYQRAVDARDYGLAVAS